MKQRVALRVAKAKAQNRSPWPRKVKGIKSVAKKPKGKKGR